MGGADDLAGRGGDDVRNALVVVYDGPFNGPWDYGSDSGAEPGDTADGGDGADGCRATMVTACESDDGSW
jgi:hypothetical protein